MKKESRCRKIQGTDFTAEDWSVANKSPGWGEASDAERHRLTPAAVLIRLAAAQDPFAT